MNALRQFGVVEAADLDQAHDEPGRVGLSLATDVVVLLIGGGQSWVVTDHVDQEGDGSPHGGATCVVQTGSFDERQAADGRASDLVPRRNAAIRADPVDALAGPLTGDAAGLAAKCVEAVLFSRSPGRELVVRQAAQGGAGV